jgi:hypothetical protein
LGTVEAYPTGGAGPTAYGPNSYYGSDPLPERSGDSLYNPIDLGNFSSVFKTITIKNQHGGLSRRQTTFYKLKLIEPRSIQFTQDFSQFSYEENTNRNTLLAFYQIFEGSRREELPINNEGYVYKESSIDYEEESTQLKDYPSTQLNTGDYLFLITNDIRFLETTYSISINVNQLDWGALNEPAAEEINFKLITETASEVLNFGEV